MKHDVNVGVLIFIFESDIRVICIHIFLILQALIADVTTIIYQYCDGSSDKKILIGHPDASSADN